LWRVGATHGEGGWQDKSRKVLGGRLARNAKNNNIMAKGVHTAITLHHAASRWKYWNLDTLQVVVP
jgi:hypothetical protein